MSFLDKMKGQEYIDKTREYLDYLEEHLENVRLAFIELSNACDGMWWVGDDVAWHQVRKEVHEHDLSKFSIEEFVPYREAFFPVDKKKDLELSAWENHKEKNFHHHESVRHYLDIVHMVIDWTAMGYKFGDTAQEYYESNKDKIKLDKEQVEFLHELFVRLDEYRKK